MSQGRSNPPNPRCAAKGCCHEVPLGRPFCRSCFNKLPQDMREAIWKSSREIAQRNYDGDVHRDNIMVAIGWTYAVRTPQT